jgi:hypothetical protein
LQPLPVVQGGGSGQARLSAFVAEMPEMRRRDGSEIIAGAALAFG